MFGDDIRTDFDVDKCAIAVFVQGTSIQQYGNRRKTTYNYTH